MILHIGLIGRGRWSGIVADTLSTFDDVSIKRISNTHDVDVSLSAVIVANASTDHAASALPYIASGVPTFIEKPMTTSVSDAERIRNVANDSGAPVFVGHIHLYNPAFEALLNTAPQLGQLRYVLCEGANATPRTDTNVLWDWLPHDLSMLMTLFGREPDSAAAWALDNDANPRAASVRYRFGDCSCMCTVSWLSPLARKTMTVVGEAGALVLDDKVVHKLIHCGHDGVQTPISHGSQRPLTRELAAFLQVVRARDASRSNLDLAVVIAHCIEAAEQSMACGGTPITISGLASS